MTPPHTANSCPVVIAQQRRATPRQKSPHSREASNSLRACLGMRTSSAPSSMAPVESLVAVVHERQDAEQDMLLDSVIVHVHETITSTITYKMGSAPERFRA